MIGNGRAHISVVLAAAVWFAAAPAVAGTGSATRESTIRLGPQRLYDSADILAAAADPVDLNAETVEGHKDPRVAMFYSLVLPGLGEMWLGHSGRARLFMVAEAGIWTAFTVFRVQGSHREDLYKSYASDLAGAPRRDDEEFYRVMANFTSSEGPFSANEQVRRQARALFPNSRQSQDAYVRDNGYFGDDTWEWESADAFERFKEMRGASLDAYSNSKLTIGLAIANRLLSALDAGVLAARHNRGTEPEKASISWDLDAGPDGPGAKVVLARTF